MADETRCTNCGAHALTRARSQVVRVSVVLGPGELLPLRPASIEYCSHCGSWQPADELAAARAPVRAVLEQAQAAL